VTAAEQLLAELRAAGVALVVEGDRLLARGRRLPPDLARRLRPHRAALVALLTDFADFADAVSRPRPPKNAGATRLPSSADIADDSGPPVLTVADRQRDGTAARLRALHAALAPAERARLAAEGAAGDHLAGLILAAVEAPELPPDPAETLAAALAPTGPGWVRLWSRVLDAEVLLVRAPDVAVPDDLAALPRFDRAELAVLAGERPDGDMLRALLEAKRAIPGARVVVDDGEGLLPLRPVGSGRRAGGGT
jgi:hypothetical protein